MARENLTVTSLEDIKKYAGGCVVELPPFAEGQPFVARLKRPSLLGLVKRGVIPNSLLVKTNELFIQNDAGFDVDDENMMAQYFDILDILANETFVEPKYTELKEAGIELTDEQHMFIFNYSQRGIKALESFRTE